MLIWNSEILKISPVEHRKKCKVQNDEDLNLSLDSMSTSTMTTMNCTSTSHDNTPKQFYVSSIFIWSNIVSYTYLFINIQSCFRV